MKWNVQIACNGLGSTFSYIEADTPGQALDRAYSENDHYYRSEWPWFPVITVRPHWLAKLGDEALFAGLNARTEVIEAAIGSPDERDYRTDEEAHRVCSGTGSQVRASKLLSRVHDSRPGFDQARCPVCDGLALAVLDGDLYRIASHAPHEETDR